MKCSETGSKKGYAVCRQSGIRTDFNAGPRRGLYLALFRGTVFVVKFRLMFCIIPERHRPGNGSKTPPLPMTLQYTGPMSAGCYIEEVPEEDPDEAA